MTADLESQLAEMVWPYMDHRHYQAHVLMFYNPGNGVLWQLPDVVSFRMAPGNRPYGLPFLGFVGNNNENSVLTLRDDDDDDDYDDDDADDDDVDDDDDASPVVIAGPGNAQAFAVYIYIYHTYLLFFLRTTQCPLFNELIGHDCAIVHRSWWPQFLVLGLSAGFG